MIFRNSSRLQYLHLSHSVSESTVRGAVWPVIHLIEIVNVLNADWIAIDLCGCLVRSVFLIVWVFDKTNSSCSPKHPCLESKDYPAVHVSIFARSYGMYPAVFCQGESFVWALLLFRKGCLQYLFFPTHTQFCLFLLSWSFQHFERRFSVQRKAKRWQLAFLFCIFL